MCIGNVVAHGCGCSVWFGNDSYSLSITERSERRTFLICDNPPWKLNHTTVIFSGHVRVVGVEDVGAHDARFALAARALDENLARVRAGERREERGGVARE